MLKQLL